MADVCGYCDIPEEGDECVPPSGGRWVVAATHPRREAFALENLERQSFVSYCPRASKRLRTRKGMREVLRPLFPGYVFVSMANDGGRFRSLRSTYGIRSVVRFGDQFGHVPQEFIERLRAREIDGVIRLRESPLHIDQSVRIAGGPFDGLIARIVEMDDKDRLTVLMALMNGEVRMKLNGSDVDVV